MFAHDPLGMSHRRLAGKSKRAGSTGQNIGARLRKFGRAIETTNNRRNPTRSPTTCCLCLMAGAPASSSRTGHERDETQREGSNGGGASMIDLNDIEEDSFFPGRI